MCCCCGRVLTVSSAFASPLRRAAHGRMCWRRQPLAASVAGTSAGRLYARTCAPVSMLCMLPSTLRGGVDIAAGLDASDIVGVLQGVRPRVAHAAPERRASTVLSGKGGCRPLVKCLGYVVRSRCYPCQAVYARTSASQDPAKALCSTRRWTRLAGLVCAAW